MLMETIQTDMREALKSRNEVRLRTLRSAMSACTNELVAKNRKPTEQLSDDGVATVLKRLAKQRKEAAEQYDNGKRPELAEREREELRVIEEYLPEAASREDIERIAKQKQEELGITDKSGMGQLMGAVMKELGGGADGNEVKDVVSGLLD